MTCAKLCATLRQIKKILLIFQFIWSLDTFTHLRNVSDWNAEKQNDIVNGQYQCSDPLPEVLSSLLLVVWTKIAANRMTVTDHTICIWICIFCGHFWFTSFCLRLFFFFWNIFYVCLVLVRYRFIFVFVCRLFLDFRTFTFQSRQFFALFRRCFFSYYYLVLSRRLAIWCLPEIVDSKWRFLSLIRLFPYTMLTWIYCLFSLVNLLLIWNYFGSSRK